MKLPTVFICPAKWHYLKIRVKQKWTKANPSWVIQLKQWKEIIKCLPQVIYRMNQLSINNINISYISGAQMLTE